MARRVGADQTVNMASAPDGLARFTADKGTFDVLYESTGAAPALAAGVGAMRPGRTILQLGLCGDMTVPVQTITARELSLTGSFRFRGRWPLRGIPSSRRWR